MSISTVIQADLLQVFTDDLRKINQFSIMYILENAMSICLHTSNSSFATFNSGGYLGLAAIISKING